MDPQIRKHVFEQTRKRDVLDDDPVYATRIRLFYVTKELSTAAFRTLTELDLPDRPIDPARRPKLEEKLKEKLRVEFLKLRKPPTRLHVLATTAEIREAGPSEVITRLHLKISEEAFEWTTIESDGQKQDRLVME